MNFIEEKKKFEAEKAVYESVKLRFNGVDGFDVYNPSIPFEFKGKKYIFGRIEKRSEWTRSWVRLFEETAKDEWSLVPDSMIYQLEDPFIQKIGEEYVLGGTHPLFSEGKLKTYYGYFYKGEDINNLYYYTTGPDYMKDIRLISLADKKIGVFSRPRSEEIRKKYGSESVVGFIVIDNLLDMNAEILENAPIIEGMFDKDEWGGCNQCYLLDSGNIGIIGHKCYNDGALQVYVNVAFVFNQYENKILDQRIIGTRSCYPAGEAKKDFLTDCAFTSGIVMRDDQRVDLYSGISDIEAGRIVIDYPFSGFGKIIM